MPGCRAQVQGPLTWGLASSSPPGCSASLCTAFPKGSMSIWVDSQALWCPSHVLNPSGFRARPWGWFSSEPRLGFGLRPRSLAGPSHLHGGDLPRGRVEGEAQLSRGRPGLGPGSPSSVSGSPSLPLVQVAIFDPAGQPTFMVSLMSPHPLRFGARPGGVVGPDFQPGDRSSGSFCRLSASWGMWTLLSP